MTEEEQVQAQQHMTTCVSNAVETMNALIGPFAPAIDAHPDGIEAMALVAVLNAYSQALSENLSLDALQKAAQVQAIIFEQMRKG